jgi:hypothetical protein
METVPKLSFEGRMKSAAELLRNELASRVASHIKAGGSLDEAKAMTDQPVWRFLGDIIGDLDLTP